jgi:hypothetical protein
MKKFIEMFLLPFIGFILFAGVVAMGVEVQMGINPYTTIAVLAIGAFLLSAMKTSKNTYPKGALRSGVEVEMWVNYIIERLWKDNKFLQLAFSDDDKVLAGKIVHIPQPGAKPTVVKNRNVYPATAVRRTDTDILYALDEYTTDPTHIPDAEKVEVSYDKINSVYGDHAGTLVEDVAGDAIYKWLVDVPATSIVRTTGGNTTEILDGATGNRKVLVHGDLRRAQKIMNKQNVPAEDRYALLSADMGDQLFESLSNTQYRDFSQYADAKEGIIGRLYGFNIMSRSFVAAANDSGGVVINPYGAEIEDTTHDVSFCWQKNAVARALGEVKFFENPDRAEYFGDVYSALLRFGGRRRRADNLGLVALVQDNG